MCIRDRVKRGRIVNRTFGPPETQLRERHDAGDFDRRKEELRQAGG